MRRSGLRILRRKIGEADTAELTHTPDTVDALSPFARWRADVGRTMDAGVLMWRDLTGGLILQQEYSVAQPSYQSSISELNNQPALRFDGSDDHLILTAAASTLNFMHRGTGFELWMVYVTRYAMNPTQNKFLFTTFLGASGTAGVALYNVSGGTNHNLTVRSNSTTIVSNNLGTAFAQDVGAWSNVSYQEGVGNPEFRNDRSGKTENTGLSSLTPTADDAALSLRVGCDGVAALFTQFDLAEIVLFNRRNTASERTDTMHPYLLSRYGVAA